MTRETILVGWYSNTSSSATRTVRSRNDDVQSFGEDWMRRSRDEKQSVDAALGNLYFMHLDEADHFKRLRAQYIQEIVQKREIEKKKRLGIWSR